jgi:nitrite reductase/ring-hydroxylating ferredoxin subunit
MSQRICQASEVTEKGREYRVNGEDGPFYLMVFRRGYNLMAYHNACPHQGRSLNFAPDRFLIGDDGLLVCAHHGAAFDLDSGDCLAGPCKGSSLRAIAIRVRDDEVWLE